MSDAELAVLSQQGNRDAFGVLAERWNPPLYRFLRRMLGDDEGARDVCQETMLRAYVNLDRLRDPDRFKSWLHTIAVNLCRDRGRTSRGRMLREVALDERSEAALPSDAASPHEEVERRDLADLVRRAIVRLPLEQRTAIVLREYEGFNSTEIATLTGVSPATVRSRIYYGLKALRRMLPDGGSPAAQIGDGGAVQ